MKDKNILILGEGAIAGAFSAGFIYELSRRRKLNYFKEIYCYSVGVYAATFGVSGQYRIIKDVWLNKIDKYKLINPFNLLTFGVKKPLKLKYLENLFSNGRDKLSIQKVLKSRIKVRYALMDYYTGKVNFIIPNKEDILKQMSAACSVPTINGSTRINNKKYLDPTFVYGTTPNVDKITKSANEIVFISNFPKGYFKYNDNKLNIFLSKNIFHFIGKFYPKSLQEIFKRRGKFIEKTHKFLEHNKKIQIIRPRKFYLRSARETDKRHIKRLFDEGIDEAKKFIEEHLM